MDRRALLSGAAAAVVLGACRPLARSAPVVSPPRVPSVGPGSVASSPVAPPSPVSPAAAGLWRHAAAKGLLFGSYVRPPDLDDPRYAALVGDECLLVTTADLKWGPVRRPGLEDFDFDLADALVDVADRERLLVRGHAVVWDRSFAPGIEEQVRASGDVEGLMTGHIQTVARRYAGRLHSLDVVNEPVATQQGRPDGLRERSVWFEAMGPHYIDVAFAAAAEADPAALLFLNDFGLETGRPPDFTAAEKRSAILRLLEGLVSRGVPIDGLGLQGHLNSAAMRERFDADGYRRFLAEVAGMGLTIMVTELDVSDRDEPPDVAVRDRAVADAYSAYLDVVLDEPRVSGVTTWGLVNGLSWLQRGGGQDAGPGQRRAREDDVRAREDGLALRPLPFDDQLRPTPAREAIAAAFDRAPAREVVSPLPVPRRFEVSGSTESGAQR